MTPIRIALTALFLLCLAGCPPAEPCPEPEPTPEPTPPPPCCSADELVQFAGEGLADEAVIERITEGRGAVLPILREAGVSDAVIEAWLEPPPEPEPEPAARGEAPPPLTLSVTYKPGKGHYVLENTGSREITDLNLTVNGEYTYELPVPLRPGQEDSVQLHSHKSRASGGRLSPVVPPPGYKHVKITKLTARAKQGTWSKSF